MLKAIVKRSARLNKFWLFVILMTFSPFASAASLLTIDRQGMDLRVQVESDEALAGDGLTLVWDSADRGSCASDWAYAQVLTNALPAEGATFLTPIDAFTNGAVFMRALTTRRVALVDGPLELRSFAYVDTGIAENIATGVEAGFYLTGGKTCNWAPVMGSSHDKFTVGCHNSRTDEVYLRYNGVDKLKYGALSTSSCNAFVIRDRTWTVNGSTVASGYDSTTLYPSGSSTIHLGTTAVRANAADANWFYFRALGSGNTPICNLVPARSGTAGTPCFYDTVGKRIVSVLGAGTATAAGTVTNTVSATGTASAACVFINGQQPALDTTRPRVGRALAATGIDASATNELCSCAWYRGTPQQVYDAEPIATGPAYTPTEEDAEHWLKFVVTVKGVTAYSHSFYFSRLPVCYLTTDDGATPTASKEKHTGTLLVQGNDDYKSTYDGAMTINVRGNSTAKLAKKPWKVKLDEKAKMFGMPKSKHWVLLANYYDPSQMRNKLMYDLANEIGTLGMKSTWVQVVLNGQLQGLYQFCEQIRIASDRVPVYDWEDAAEEAADAIAASHGLPKANRKELEEKMAVDLAWVTSGRFSYGGTNYDVRASWPDYSTDISGGYLFEFSYEMDAVTQFYTTSGKLKMKTMVSSPEYLKTNTEMLSAAQQVLQDYWDACTSASRRTADGRHYAELCDVESMAAYFLINEFVYDFDGRYRSRFAYKDRDGKIVWGPVWDFDWSSRSITASSCPVDEWACYALWQQYPNDTKYYSMYKDWASDFYFARKCCEKYWKVRHLYAEMFADGGVIDQYAAKLAAAWAVDDALWPRSRTAAEDAEKLKAYFAERIVWLDQQFATPETFVESMRNSEMQSNESTHDWTETTEATGSVPAIPLDWLRVAGEGADASLGYAEAATLRGVATNVPSVWGKATPLWQDYVLGTDPDPASTNATFRITSIRTQSDGAPQLTWLPNLGSNRVYTVLGSTNFVTGAWHTPTNSLDRFFKVRVELP